MQRSVNCISCVYCDEFSVVSIVCNVVFIVGKEAFDVFGEACSGELLHLTRSRPHLSSDRSRGLGRGLDVPFCLVSRLWLCFDILN